MQRKSVILAERMAERAQYSRPLLEFKAQGLLMEAGQDDRLLSCNVFPISELTNKPDISSTLGKFSS